MPMPAQTDNADEPPGTSEVFNIHTRLRKKGAESCNPHRCDTRVISDKGVRKLSLFDSRHELRASAEPPGFVTGPVSV